MNIISRILLFWILLLGYGLYAGPFSNENALTAFHLENEGFSPYFNTSAGEDVDNSNQASTRPQIPVLGYHTFYSEEWRRKPGTLDVSYQEFEETLEFLYQNGFKSYLPNGELPLTIPDPQRVIITFDDGHRSQLRAAELLESYGMRGIFFVIASLIDDPEYPHLTSENLASLVRRGHQVGAHGHRHRSMPISGPEIVATLDTVPDILKNISGISDKNIHSLAFPYGHYTPAVKRAMRSRYPLQYSVNPGYWDGISPLIPRILLTRDADPRFYKEYLLGAYIGEPKLFMKEEDGSRQSVIHFDNPAGLSPDSLYLKAASPDYKNRHYQLFSVSDFMVSEGDAIIFDITGYLETHHSKTRRALSFAVMQRKNGGYAFVSDGYLLWIKKQEQ